MITVQRQGSEPVQAAPAVVSQLRPWQQPTVGEHAWPLAEQVAPGWQVPRVEPAGTSHRRPWQQSAPEVQAPLCGWHSAGGLHTPLVQMPEQHCEGEEQDVSLALQAGPASGVPVPASVPPEGGRGCWQAELSSSTGRQLVPEQQPEPPSAPLLQELPSGEHVGRWHVSWPVLLGMQSASPQHWSENWQF